jgi:uncharacterized surface protein with fasciclin (FAS1) repeats
MDVNKSNSGMAVVAILVALVVGGLGGYLVGNGMDSDDTSMTKNSTTSTTSSNESDGVTVGGAKMVRTKDIVDNAANAKNVTTVVAAVKAAGLVETLKGEGPFTVFGPNNDAFAALPAGTVDTLLKPENKEQLVSILTYHVVAGTYTSADLKAMAQKGETLKTVQGGELTPVINGTMVELKDAKGTMVQIETADIISSNGVTHVIKSVLMPM